MKKDTFLSVENENWNVWRNCLVHLSNESFSISMKCMLLVESSPFTDRWNWRGNNREGRKAKQSRKRERDNAAQSAIFIICTTKLPQLRAFTGIITFMQQLGFSFTKSQSERNILFIRIIALGITKNHLPYLTVRKLYEIHVFVCAFMSKFDENKFHCHLITWNCYQIIAILMNTISQI